MINKAVRGVMGLMVLIALFGTVAFLVMVELTQGRGDLTEIVSSLVGSPEVQFVLGVSFGLLILLMVAKMLVDRGSKPINRWRVHPDDEYF